MNSVTSTRRVERSVWTLRDAHERVVAERAVHAALVLRLDLVVELVGDALAQLGEQRLGVHPRRHPLEQRHEQLHVAQVGLDRLGDARVLDLDRDVVALVRRRAVDLADRRGGDRALVERREVLVERAAEVALGDLAHVLEGDLRRAVAQRRQALLELLALALGDEVEVDGGEHLADLHRRALHLPELLDELVGEVERAALVGGGRLVVGAHPVRDVRRRPLHALAAHERAEPGGPGEAALGDLGGLLVVGHGGGADCGHPRGTVAHGDRYHGTAGPRRVQSASDALRRRSRDTCSGSRSRRRPGPAGSTRPPGPSDPRAGPTHPRPARRAPSASGRSSRRRSPRTRPGSGSGT